MARAIADLSDAVVQRPSLLPGWSVGYVLTHLKRQTSDPYAYDLLVNSGRLGEEVCAELIAQAARTKLLHSETLSPRPDEER